MKPFSRLAQMTGLFAAIACMVLLSPLAQGKGAGSKAQGNLKSLMEGNARFAAGAAVHPDQGADRRSEVTHSQHPAAVVVSCSDSRVPPELLFDQGIGDLFVVRVAGNVLDEINIGSVEYGVEHLGAPLIVVLGHQRCGAVQAAVKGGKAPGHIGSIVNAIAPAVAEARKCGTCKDLVEAAAHLNVERVVSELKDSDPLLAHLVAEKKLSVVGAFYDLDSGKVTLLPSSR